ncbi:MAG TPA: hypothetical protein VKA08_07835 [Balneolales bacterium]|nr:hypothetical protein [Balneolales bacterium]
MKTLKNILGTTLALLLFGGLFNGAYAQYKKELQYYRPIDQSGIYMFTPNKDQKGYEYDGFKMYVGAGLTQQWQDLFEKTAGINPATGTTYALTPIGNGFNLPTANLYLDAQLAQGMRLHLTTYLSSRHHNETWVKGGYLRVDALPMLHSDVIDNIMQYVSIKIGDMEINYGDTHFLRSDNANTIYNDLVGNYLMDSFTTMDGAEVYVFNKGFIGMLGYAGGQAGEHPQVSNPDGRRPGIYAKLGYDSKVGDDARIRLTGSIFHDARYQALYAGDRSGSRYYNIMGDAVSGDPFSGRVHPAFHNGFTSFMINPYVQVGGLNLFGVIETTKEMTTGNNVQQYAIDARYFVSNSVYLAARYNTVKGYLAVSGSGNPNKSSSVDRVQFGGGWFMTPNILAKVEYVSQNYKKFADASVYNGGEFHGLMLEAAIGF